jgi:hypothetical protein
MPSHVTCTILASAYARWWQNLFVCSFLYVSINVVGYYNTLKKLKRAQKVVMPTYAPAVWRVMAGGTLTASSIVLVIAETPPFIAKILRRTRGEIGRGPEITEAKDLRHR